MPVELESEGACLLCKQGEVNVLRHSSVSRHFSKRVLVIVVVSGVLSVAVSTVKTDVYSFGIVVLEVASGRWPVDEEGTVITECVWSLWECGKLLEAVDSKLMGRFDRVRRTLFLKTEQQNME